MQSALAPFTMKGFYLLTWGTALGSNVYSSVVRVPLSVARSFADRILLFHRLAYVLDHSFCLCSVRRSHVPEPSQNNLRQPPSQTHPSLLLLPNPDLRHSPPNSPILPPFPHLLAIGRTTLGDMRGRSSRFAHPCVARTVFGQLGSGGTFDDGGDAGEASTGGA